MMNKILAKLHRLKSFVAYILLVGREELAEARVRWRERRRQQAFKNGFLWALNKFYGENKPLKYLEEYVNVTKHCDTFGPFDAGVKYAVDAIRSSKSMRDAMFVNYRDLQYFKNQGV